MTPAPSITRQSIDQLEDNLVCLSKRVNASEYEFLVLLREFDLRQGWKAYLFNHCADWLNLKCGMHPNTGREKVRVAHGLWDLPLLSAAFQSGELSYSKARALTRVATPANESGLLDYAMGHTADRVENHCRALRNGQREISTRDANRIHKSRYLSSCRHGDGRMTISVDLGLEEGELVMKALEQAMTDRDREDRSVEHVRDTSAEVSDDHRRSENFFAHCADALVTMATAYLAGGSGKTSCSADRYQVVVHVDERALRMSSRDGNTSAEGSQVAAAKSDLPIESVRRLCCDGSLVALTEDEHGTPLNVGRKHRVVPPALKRALLARDQGCAYPGCSHQHYLDAHHIRHWVDGGETSLENTILLCRRHHGFLHEGGFSIKKNYRGEYYFETSQGKVIPGLPVYQRRDEPGCEGIAEARASYRVAVRTSAEVSPNGHLVPLTDGSTSHAWLARHNTLAWHCEYEDIRQIHLLAGARLKIPDARRGQHPHQPSFPTNQKHALRATGVGASEELHSYPAMPGGYFPARKSRGLTETESSSAGVHSSITTQFPQLQHPVARPDTEIRVYCQQPYAERHGQLEPCRFGQTDD